ncbi:MAG: hypothetical protein P4L27_13100 [Ignavibacteriaceae bacterium]|nr:hypothetical protein [Ignavibacteriaceae bacterium]
MKRNIIYILLLLLILAALNNTFLAKNKIVINTYFPVNNNKTLVYNSSFGKSITKNSGDGDLTITSSKSDKFRYSQKLIIKEDGVYVKETYQFLNILLFIKKEETYTYNKPLLRFPLPLTAGREWKWDGEEYSKNGTDKVKITGKVFHKEFVITKAGTFEAIKLESVVESSTNEKNKITEWYVEGIGLIKAKIMIEGGGIMGFLRDILGYSTIEFELKEIRNT